MVDKGKRNLTLFGFFSLTASMVLAVYEYPTFATSKLNLVFYLILAGIFWFYRLLYVPQKWQLFKDGIKMVEEF